ncbi:MAG: M20/M25/M40 family metallo-hydrolase, partial [Verrucomicrobiales bacterium]|nr:M20/M25/M40 family metallo-hydrolase [Verrucomicrobiales bacterium]
VEWFGDFGMWKLNPFVIHDGLIHSRVCDDLVGCCAILALLMDLSKRGVTANFYGIFTRAEEVGFMGAVKMAKDWWLPEGVRFVSLETSAPRGGAEMGKGPVIRVGDKMSVFDDAVTAELIDAAAAEKIPAQRCLLDGGSCEATAMNLYGIPAAGMSVLLGNYHNCPPDRGIAEEFVSLADVKGMIKLITATVERMASGGKRESAKAAMKKRIEKRMREHEKYDRASKSSWKE